LRACLPIFCKGVFNTDNGGNKPDSSKILRDYHQNLTADILVP